MAKNDGKGSGGKTIIIIIVLVLGLIGYTKDKIQEMRAPDADSAQPTAVVQATETQRPTATAAPTATATLAPTATPTNTPTPTPQRTRRVQYTPVPTPDFTQQPKTRESSIKTVIEMRIGSTFRDTDIRSITINPDSGTSTPDDYIALVYLTWTMPNSGKTSKEMLLLYSEDLAAYLAGSCPDVQELAIFWHVDYLNADAKCSYERKGDKMYEMDMMFGPAFN